MAENYDLNTDTARHGGQGSLRRGWPALILTAGMIGATIYAFSPRPYPPFPQTRVHAGQFIAEGLAHQGDRYIVVGELGHILYTDKPRGVWHQAQIKPGRSATLTQVKFVDDNTVVAVGQSDRILRSTDAGKTWQEVYYDKAHSDPLLGISGPYDGKLYAYGSFGQFFESDDLGKTWNSRTLELAKPGGADKKQKASSANDPDSPDYDPFAAFAAGGGVQSLAEKHYNGMVKASDGALYLLGERGLVARSTDNGQTWTELKQFYDGSFYGGVALPGGGVLIYGMLGHAYLTHDHGQSWQASKIPNQQGIYGGMVTSDGSIVLVGGSNSVYLSKDNGASFKLLTGHGPNGLVSVLKLSDGNYLIAGEGGVEIKTPKGASVPVARGSKS